MNRQQVEDQIRALTARRAEAEQQLRKSEQRLAEVENEQKDLEGALTLARRAITDLDARAEQLKDELRVVAIEEARDAVDQAVQARQTAAEEAAQAARRLRLAYDRLQKARQAVTEAHGKLRDLGIDRETPLGPEQALFVEELQSVATLVEHELNIRLEARIVEAAAASGKPFDIEALPEHLQELARARRRDFLRELPGRTAS